MTINANDTIGQRIAANAEERLQRLMAEDAKKPATNRSGEAVLRALVRDMAVDEYAQELMRANPNVRNDPQTARGVAQRNLQQWRQQFTRPQQQPPQSGPDSPYARNDLGSFDGNEWDSASQPAYQAAQPQNQVGRQPDPYAYLNRNSEGPFDSFGDVSRMFGRRPPGSVGGRQNNGGVAVRSAQEQRARSGMMQDALAAGLGWRFDGGMGGGGGGGTGGGASNADLAYAYQQQQGIQGQMMNLLGGMGGGVQDARALLQQAIANEGMPAEVYADRQRSIMNRNALAASNARQGLENRLAANGGLASPAAGKAFGQLGLQANANVNDAMSQLNALDAETRARNRMANMSSAMQLAGIDQQGRLGAANVLGNIQVPVLPGMSSGFSGATMGGGMNNPNMGSSRYQQMLAMNGSPMPQPNNGYRMGQNQGTPNFNSTLSRF